MLCYFRDIAPVGTVCVLGTIYPAENECSVVTILPYGVVHIAGAFRPAGATGAIGNIVLLEKLSPC